MTDLVCEGCGAPLQSEAEDRPGYVPAHILRGNDGAVCRRCYRMSHYSKDETGPQSTADDAWSIVSDTAPGADASVLMVDLLDFEGSFLPRLTEITGGPLFVVANKVDLLPPKTPVEEVTEWVHHRLDRASIKPEAVFPISAGTGYGVRVLLDTLKRVVPRGGKVSLLGATNVGKSTLLDRWLQGSPVPGPTTSSFPGTTVGVVEREVGRGELIIMDMPGLSTRGRISEMFCPACGSNLVPAAPIVSKLLRIRDGQSIVFGGLAGITPLGLPGERTSLVFAPGDVSAHRVRASTLMDRLRDGASHGRSGREPKGASLCESCCRKVETTGWEQVVLDVQEMEDVAIHGLGWLSPRHGPLKVRVDLPAGAAVSVRPRLVGPKKGRGARGR